MLFKGKANMFTEYINQYDVGGKFLAAKVIFSFCCLLLKQESKNWNSSMLLYNEWISKNQRWK